MTRYVKCRLKSCGMTHSYSTRENLIRRELVLTNGSKRNLYYCGDDCYNKALEEENFIKEENEKKDTLNDLVKEIYGVSDNVNLPVRWWEFIQDLRNGTNRYQKFWKKRYKQGVPYEIIIEAYKMSRDNIRWAKLNRNFRAIDQELRYGLAIVSGKLADADRKLKRSEVQRKASVAMEESRIEHMEDIREVKFKKQTNEEEDLSFLFGED